jgi:hypothetical protein
VQRDRRVLEVEELHSAKAAARPLGIGLEQLEHLELAAGEVHALRADEGLELVGADLELADDERPGVHPRGGSLAATDDRFHAREHLLRMARLRHPVVGAEPQAAHALGDRWPSC